jgi:hypothetical protein
MTMYWPTPSAGVPGTRLAPRRRRSGNDLDHVSTVIGKFSWRLATMRRAVNGAQIHMLTTRGTLCQWPSSHGLDSLVAGMSSSQRRGVLLSTIKSVLRPPPQSRHPVHPAISEE